MKKLTFFAGLSFLVLAAVAGAQTPNVGVGSGQGQGSAGVAVGNPIIIVNPVNLNPVSTTTSNNIIQFNNLTVQSVSATVPPAEIVASGNAVYNQGGQPPVMQPMTSAAGGQHNVAGTITALQPQVRCLGFFGRNPTSGTLIPCPTPPPIPIMPQPVTSGTTGGAVPAQPSPLISGTYRIEVSAATHLMLSDRAAAALADFAVSDQINVYGIYNDDGTIDALIVRDLSKPVVKQFVQLNNVNLVSVSAATAPATLTVVQQVANPCYGFGSEGNTNQGIIACPMGLQSFSDNTASRNVTVPQSIMPILNQSRKYVIQIDTQTILMNRERGTLALTDFKVGDQLNIYGATLDANGATIDADIVRDLSLPATVQNYSGRVTQVNSDGSFVIQLNDGSTYTVQNPVQVGTTVQLKGLLDQLQKIISQVSQIILR